MPLLIHGHFPNGASLRIEFYDVVDKGRFWSAYISWRNESLTAEGQPNTDALFEVTKPYLFAANNGNQMIFSERDVAVLKTFCEGVEERPARPLAINDNFIIA